MQYSGGVYTTLPASGFLYNGFSGLNNAGQIVGAYGNNGYTQAFLYSGGTYTPLNMSGAGATGARGINDAGQVVGGYLLGATRFGFVYDIGAGTYTTLNIAEAQANSINDKGQVVGEFFGAGCSSSPSDCGFFFDTSTLTAMTLIFPGATETFAVGINDAGQIVGIADLASSTPLPATLPLFATGFGVLGFLASRRKAKVARRLAPHLSAVAEGIKKQQHGIGMRDL